MEGSFANVPKAIQWAAFSFAVDRVTAEVVTALDAASVPSILVKGPAIATWLYSGDRPRLYTDTDLLVRRSDWDRAMAVLRELGFEDDLASLAHPRMESGAGYPWGRPADGADVDLHYTLFGIGVEPEVLWEAFAEDAVRERVGGLEVAMPSHPARLLHIALHAVQHGGEAQEKPMMDLEHAVAKAPAATWLEAHQLARRLEAVDSFAAGLRLTAEGRELAAAIGVFAEGSSPGAALRLGQVPMAEGFQQLAAASGLRAKVALIVRELFPTPTFMRWWSLLARRGPVGLLLSYGWRLIWLAYRAVPGFRAWRRAHSISADGGSASRPARRDPTPARDRESRGK